MFNIRNFAVVDDAEENRNAAKQACTELYPQATIHQFSSGREFIKSLKNGLDVDLVLSDMSMEERHSRYVVAIESWARGIPAVIVSGGINHGKDYVLVGYPELRLGGTKNSPLVWGEILNHVLSQEESMNGVAFQLGQGVRRSVPDYNFGEVCAVVTAFTVLRDI